MIYIHIYIALMWCDYGPCTYVYITLYVLYTQQQLQKNAIKFTNHNLKHVIICQTGRGLRVATGSLGCLRGTTPGIPSRLRLRSGRRFISLLTIRSYAIRTTTQHGKADAKFANTNTNQQIKKLWYPTKILQKMWVAKALCAFFLILCIYRARKMNWWYIRQVFKNTMFLKRCFL